LNEAFEDYSGFSNNITFSFNDFCNEFYNEKDYNSYTKDIWTPNVDAINELTLKKSNFISIKGKFLLTFYKVCKDLNVCNGIIEIYDMMKKNRLPLNQFV